MQSDQLIRLIQEAGENSDYDAKGPMEWDKAEASAKLTKHILGFANSRDGGVLVLGKTEVESGKFDLKGLSKEQAASFDITKVTAWVNARCDPEVNIKIYRQEHEGREFVVIAIMEFDEVPILCTKTFDNPKDKKKPLLQKGTIYMRNEKAETVPVLSAAEMRKVVGLATKKQGDELLSRFSAMLKGRDLSPKPTDGDNFNGELSRVVESIDENLEYTPKLGAWEFSFHPTDYVERRWDDRPTLEGLISRYSMRGTPQFPGHFRGTHPREWGIANDLYGEAWALTFSGLFVFLRGLRENKKEYGTQNRTVHSDGREYPGIPAGKWVAYQWTIYQFADFFQFMSRFSDAFTAGTEITYQLNGQPLKGKFMASIDPFNVNIGHVLPFDRSGECRVERYSHTVTVTVEDLRSDWENLCASALAELMELFPDLHLPHETFISWMEKFKKRRY